MAKTQGVMVLLPLCWWLLCVPQMKEDVKKSWGEWRKPGRRSKAESKLDSPERDRVEGSGWDATGGVAEEGVGRRGNVWQ